LFFPPCYLGAVGALWRHPFLFFVLLVFFEASLSSSFVPECLVGKARCARAEFRVQNWRFFFAFRFLLVHGFSFPFSLFSFPHDLSRFFLTVGLFFPFSTTLGREALHLPGCAAFSPFRPSLIGFSPNLTSIYPSPFLGLKSLSFSSQSPGR